MVTTKIPLYPAGATPAMMTGWPTTSPWAADVVIVPVGSKGGFVVKNPPPPTDRESWMREGVACYQTFLRGLLDLTDNRVGNQIVPPPDVVRVTGKSKFAPGATTVGRPFG